MASPTQEPQNGWRTPPETLYYLISRCGFSSQREVTVEGDEESGYQLRSHYWATKLHDSGLDNDGTLNKLVSERDLERRRKG